MNIKEMDTGLVLLVLALIIWDISRKGSILRAMAKQVGSIGLDDFLAGLFAA